MLNDKHIRQHAECLIDESSFMEINRDIPEQAWETMIEMYKKGYQDCLDDIKMRV
jgi:type III secretion system FlhB-like substrate exporter